MTEFRPRDGQEHKRLAREYHELPNEKDIRKKVVSSVAFVAV
jgi:hypothetical protein